LAERISKTRKRTFLSAKPAISRFLSDVYFLREGILNGAAGINQEGIHVRRRPEQRTCHFIGKMVGKISGRKYLRQPIG